MNRIEQKFRELREQKRKAFIAFITAGDPDLRTTAELVEAFEHIGVDIIELGVPFSDPLADGPIIQASYHRALNRGTTVKKILAAVKQLRHRSSLPIALMSSYNPLFHFGERKFIKACVEAGVDGLIVPDLPPEEAQNLRGLARKHNIAMVFFVAPTTMEARIKSNTQAATGFVYYVSLTGITGTKRAVASSVVRHVKHIQRFTSKPVCVGFGISTPQQVAAIGRAADGIIVGSAIVKAVEAHQGQRDLVPRVTRYVSSLVKALR